MRKLMLRTDWPSHLRRFGLALVVCWGLATLALGAAPSQLDPAVAAVLTRQCLECHQSREPAGGLALDSRAALLKGGESGPAIAPGSPDDSYLLTRIHDEEMPPPVKGVTQRLSGEEQQVLADWIEGGAVWPATQRLDLYATTNDRRGGRDWWAFQPVRRPHVPSVKNSDWARNPIDRFILAKLEQAQLQPAPDADSGTLVRRLFFDITGLPPSHDELTEWQQRLDRKGQLADQRVVQLDALIKQLMGRPQFGERWARHWLDLVRYAESSGYERDQPKAFAWKYRDWVVDAINQDLPINQFILHQLAGDEIDDADLPSHIATGFLRLGTWNDEPNDPADYLYERLEDLVHATSSAFLGLTVKCARCHDHKFDPIPQDDYYRVASAFWPGPVAARERKHLGGPTPEELGYQDVLGWTDISNQPTPLHVLKNGQRHQPLHAIQPGTLTLAPQMFAEFQAPPAGAKTTHRRRQLAEWIIRDDNPLTARVFVNRLWQHHFGHGLVRSPNNFGFKGATPTHPLLLDWLAAELVSNNWSARHIHQLILSSRTWQQASSVNWQADYAQRDAGNTLWWRANRRRLDAEALRDRLLWASGELDLSQVGGPSFKPTFSAEALEGLSRKGSDRKAAAPDAQRRRSLYIYVSRSLMPPMMTTFDLCDTTLPCAQREVTTSPTQALAMLNNQFVYERSVALATRVLNLDQRIEQQIDTAWKFTLGRLPNANERRLAGQHLRAQSARFAALKSAGVPSTPPQTRRRALASLCHVLLNTNEFLYVD